ncbi:hypothetical protein AbraIFM66951_011140 [Aspergillus brasiliensis]|nr:hypothetical protein AbraIFM66951_011140 [Aspergillus brasiliensis]
MELLLWSVRPMPSQYYWHVYTTVAAKCGRHGAGPPYPTPAEIHARSNRDDLTKLLTERYAVELEQGTQGLIGLQEVTVLGFTTAAITPWGSGYERRQTVLRNVDMLMTSDFCLRVLMDWLSRGNLHKKAAIPNDI